MFVIIGNDIHITRGDTGRCGLDIKKSDGTDYDVQEGDGVLFTVKASPKDAQFLIQKDIGTSGQIIIDPEDTENLDYGSYFYDVQLTRVADGSVNTIITPSAFVVEEEVTF